MSLPSLFEHVSPAVVVIQTVEKTIQTTKSANAKVQNVKGLGSGVLISADGKVLTASHVVHTADVVAITFQNGEQVPAHVIGSSPGADVALLQLDHVPAGYHHAHLGNSDQVVVGETIMVIGAPYGISKTLTVGYISGRKQPEQLPLNTQQLELFQSDVAVNTGNSGGPMFNMRGEVIGIVSSILTRSGGFEGISFAVTSNTAKALMMEQPSYWLGIDAVILSPSMAAVFNVPQDSGILIQRVAEGSLGKRLGLKAGFLPMKAGKEELIAGGDIIMKVMGQPIPHKVKELPTYFQQIREYLQTHDKGSIFSVTVLRNGVIQELAMTIPKP
jgi:S1-C subfamily serine protease